MFKVNPMGVRFLRFDILPNNPLGGLEELEELEEAEVGEELGGGGMLEDNEEADEAFCHVTEPGKAGWREN